MDRAASLNRYNSTIFGGITVKLCVVAALLYGLGMPVQRADAGVYTYSGSSRQINAGILLIDSGGQDPSQNSNTSEDLPAPYSFYILNQRPDIKPFGWNIVNPLAPTNVPANYPKQYTGYQLGQQVMPNMAIYWQIDLKSIAASFGSGNDPLRQFDLLVIHSHAHGTAGAIGLSRVEREILRQYVDEGGTLWIEDCGGASTMIDDSNAGADRPAGLFSDVQFQDAGTTQGFAYIPDNDHRNPLITTPYFLSDEEINDLGDKDVGMYFMSSMNSSSSPYAPPDEASLVSVVGNSAYIGSTGEALPYVAAGDYGSGHIVIDNADSMDDISNTVMAGQANTGFCTGSVQISHEEDLKYVVNMIAWSGNTSETDQANDRRSGYQNVPMNGALLKSWVYPDVNAEESSTSASAGQTQVPTLLDPMGTAISSNIAYVTSQDTPVGGGSAVGRLRAFDLIPEEDLNEDGSTDDGNSGAEVDPITGIKYNADWSRGLSYDALWSVDLPTPNVSAPVFAYLEGGGQFDKTGYSGSVMVETDNGQVDIYDATCDPNAATITPIAALPSSAGSGTFSTQTGFTSVLAPAYYRGWLVVPQPVSGGHASVYVYNFNQGSGGYVTLDGTGTDTAPIVTSPVIASIPSNDGLYGGTDIVCYVSTTDETYSLFLGSRDEKLSGATGTKAAAMNSNITGPGMTLTHAPEDNFNVGGTGSSEYAFTYLNDTPTWPASSGSTPYGPEFRGATVSGFTVAVDKSSTDPDTAFADYDLVISGSGNQIERHQIDSSVDGGTSSTPPANQAIVVGEAVGPDDVLYQTVNEAANGSTTGYIEAISEQNPLLGSSKTIVKWRFALTSTTAAQDGDGIAYPFSGYQFVGPPVVDGSNVYALATDGSNVSILCFNPNPQIQINIGQSIDTQTPPTITQTDELGTSHDISPQEYSLLDAGTGIYNVTNFASSVTSNIQVMPALGVPMPVTVALQTLDTGNDAATGSATTTGTYPISTNGNGTPLLEWWTTTTLASPPASVLLPSTFKNVPGNLRKLGNFLYFADGVTASGQTQLDYYDARQPTSSTVRPFPNTLRIFLDSGLVTNGLAASGTYAVAVGQTLELPATAQSPSPNLVGGIEGVNYGYTLIADNNRILEVDPNGAAVWAMDSTTQQGYAGDYSYATDSTTEFPGSTATTTKVGLSRPSSVSQLSGNDVLFADTGNNRCVQVDHSGHVLWEMTNFRDPNGILAPGQVLALNHPTDVITWVVRNINSSNQTVVVNHYLIADAGNYRVLEITDTYTNGQIADSATDYHILVWASHTFDKKNRQYRFVSAQQYTDAANPPVTYIVAAVSNTQVAPLVGANNDLDAASKDADGSSILILTYNPGTPYTTVGYNGLPNTVISAVKWAGATTPPYKPIRNLRFLTVYTPSYEAGNSTTPISNFMIADDDGVFDGQFTTGASILDATPHPSTPGYVAFAFTTTDYNNMVSSYAMVSGITDPYPLNAFTATSAQRLSNGDYLITNGASRGDAKDYDPHSTDNDQHSGGCVFEVIPATSSTADTLYGPIIGRSFSGNGNTGPLDQPSFSLRAQ